MDERNGRSSEAPQARPEGPPPAGPVPDPVRVPTPDPLSVPPRADPLAAARATYDRAHLVLRQWCDQLQIMLAAARGDDEAASFNPAAGSKEARELVLALKAAHDAEQKFNDLYASIHPEPDDDGFDLEAARLEIGCRIARIRACCGEDGLPGEPGAG